MSILSFPQRGPWGKSSWRGNCTGFVYKDLFERLQPKSFCDAMVGSGTSVEVAKEMGIEAYGLDLHSGFNILRDSIVKTVGKEVDIVLTHPPTQTWCCTQAINGEPSLILTICHTASMTMTLTKKCKSHF